MELTVFFVHIVSCPFTGHRGEESCLHHFYSVRHESAGAAGPDNSTALKLRFTTVPLAELQCFHPLLPFCLNLRGFCLLSN